MLKFIPQYLGSLRLAVILLLIHVVVSAIIFHFGWVPQLQSLAGGQDILDNRAGYDAPALYETLVAYGEEGRNIYSAYLVFIDSPCTLLTGLVFAAFTATIIGQRKGTWKLLYLLPVWIVLLDIVENIAMLWILNTFPQELPALASVMGQITALKMIAVNASFLLVLIALALGLIRWLKGRRAN
ncbi:MAG: hypothetical protein DWQ07_20075 [Chloroflexi bacterium]|nr:MAG: hypothetical protein DWQ07_20075 [Chloroflexota bacterium]MBL1194379.1 hypothetical protein [Chloroflexota bacterium]NOH11667.1 hypothetical protein [Chloroflexota bacterium]